MHLRLPDYFLAGIGSDGFVERGFAMWPTNGVDVDTATNQQLHRAKLKWFQREKIIHYPTPVDTFFFTFFYVFPFIQCFAKTIHDRFQIASHKVCVI